MTILSLYLFSCQPLKNTVSFHDHLSHPAAYFTRTVLVMYSQKRWDMCDFFFFIAVFCWMALQEVFCNFCKYAGHEEHCVDLRKDDIPCPMWDSAAGPLHYREKKCNHCSVLHWNYHPKSSFLTQFVLEGRKITISETSTCCLSYPAVWRHTY